MNNIRNIQSQIKNWIKNGKDWQQGLAIYDQCPGMRKKLKKRFERGGPNSFNRSLLENELSTTLHDLNIHIKAAHRKPQPPPTRKIKNMPIPDGHSKKTAVSFWSKVKKAFCKLWGYLTSFFNNAKAI